MDAVIDVANVVSSRWPNATTAPMETKHRLSRRGRSDGATDWQRAGDRIRIVQSCSSAFKTGTGGLKETSSRPILNPAPSGSGQTK